MTIFAILAAPPYAIAPQHHPGIISDGDFEALITVTPVDAPADDSNRPIQVKVKLTLEGKRGSHLIKNPFFDDRLACTCHILVYDGSLAIVGLFPLKRAVDSRPEDRVKDRTILTPGWKCGRTMTLLVSREAVAMKQPLYVQAVVLNALLNGYGTIEPIDSSSLASYQASLRDHVAGVSSPIQLRLHPSDMPRDDTSVNVTIEWRDTPPRQGFVKIAARLTNASSNDIYAPHDLFLPVTGWLGGPALVAETPAGTRLEIDDGRAHWPQREKKVLCLPPGAFIECDRTFRVPEVLHDENALREEQPITLRLIGIAALQRRSPNQDFGLTVSLPSADHFFRLPISPSNPIPLLRRMR